MKTTKLVSFAVILFSSLASDFAFAKCLDLKEGEDSTTPNSWCWPLHRPARDAEGNLTVGVPRQLVFNGFGDFQDFETPNYLHPGIDIMGSYVNDVTLSNGSRERLPDITVIPYDSELVWVFDHNDCRGQSISKSSANMSCRLFFRTRDENFLYYFGHVRYHNSAQSGEAEPNTRMRDALTALLPGRDSTAGAYRCVDPRACAFSRGEFGPMLTDFYGYDKKTRTTHRYNHLHFSIVDRRGNYDNVTPLKYLAKSAMVDETPWDTSDNRWPVIDRIALLPNDVYSDVTSVIEQGECGDEVSGNIDVAAEAYDVFREPDPTLPLPERFTTGVDNEMAVHSAVYYVERIVDATTRESMQAGTWYEFSRAPMFCPGPDRGLDCPFDVAPILNPPDDDIYFKVYSVWSLEETETDYGAPPMGVIPWTDLKGNPILADGYTIYLYRKHKNLSSADWTKEKKATLVLTNEWGLGHDWYTKPGLDTSWNTTKMSDGKYNVSVMVTDYAGHTDSQSITVRVRNGNRGDQDIWVADSSRDVATVPSNADGQPYDMSPDILVISADEDNGSDPKSTTTIDSLEALRPYHVWVRVRSGLCQSISGIKVALASVDPADANDQNDWKPIPGPDIGFVGPSWATGGASLSPGQDADWIGPFAWTPGVDEGGGSNGRLLIVAVTSHGDSSVATDMLDVPGHNNVAERRLSIALPPGGACPILYSIGIGSSIIGGHVSNESVENVLMIASTETTCSYVGDQSIVADGVPTPLGQAQLACRRQLNERGNLECSLNSANPQHTQPLAVACNPATGSCCVIGSPLCSLS